MADFDSPWKDALDEFLEEFLLMFFPAIHAAIDWSVPVENLQSELSQVTRDAELGPRTVDRLYRVALKGGGSRVMHIHVEVQCQYDIDLPERVFVYNYRVYDLAGQMPVTIVVFGDDRPRWKPGLFKSELLGNRHTFKYNTVKLLDFRKRVEELEKSPNPFAPFLIAHLQTLATRKDMQARKDWKFRLLRGLYDRGLDRRRINALFRLIDWIMDIPKDLTRQLKVEYSDFVKGLTVPYVISFERVEREDAIRRGWLIGRHQLLEEEMGRQTTQDDQLNELPLEDLSLRLASIEKEYREYKIKFQQKILTS